MSLYTWIVIAAALLAANLPFINQQLFAVITLRRAPDFVKPVWCRLLELLALYFLLGALAQVLEAAIGNVFVQRWEFYAITGCVFLVLAFPGYVFRYLYKHHA